MVWATTRSAPHLCNTQESKVSTKEKPSPHIKHTVARPKFILPSLDGHGGGGAEVLAGNEGLVFSGAQVSCGLA